MNNFITANRTIILTGLAVTTGLAIALVTLQGEPDLPPPEDQLILKEPDFEPEEGVEIVALSLGPGGDQSAPDLTPNPLAGQGGFPATNGQEECAAGLEASGALSVESRSRIVDRYAASGVPIISFEGLQPMQGSPGYSADSWVVGRFPDVDVADSFTDAGVLYFVGSIRVLDEIPSAYNGEMSFDLMSGDATGEVMGDDIVIVSPGGVLVYQFAEPANVEPTRYRVRLAPGPGWTFGDGAGFAATAEQMQCVLSSDAVLYIRGQFHATDRGALMNDFQWRGRWAMIDVEGEIPPPPPPPNNATIEIVAGEKLEFSGVRHGPVRIVSTERLTFSGVRRPARGSERER